MTIIKTWINSKDKTINDSTTMSMNRHDMKANRIATQLKTRNNTAPLSLKKKAVSHEVPKAGQKKEANEKLDISDLNEILEINTKHQYCISEPGALLRRLSAKR